MKVARAYFFKTTALLFFILWLFVLVPVYINTQNHQFVTLFWCITSLLFIVGLLAVVRFIIQRSIEKGK